jgi:hypothetical protein
LYDHLSLPLLLRHPQVFLHYFIGNQPLSGSGICRHIQNHHDRSHNVATTSILSSINLLAGLINQPGPSTSSNTPTQSGSSSANAAEVKTTGKAVAAKLRFGESNMCHIFITTNYAMTGLQVELPLHTMEPSKDTVLRVLDILDSWTAEETLSTIMSEMGLNADDHKIAYKTSKMKARENSVLIDCAGTLAAGLEVQRQIQSRAFEQKRLKIINLVIYSKPLTITQY